MTTQEELDKILSLAKIGLLTNKATTFISNVSCSLETHYDDKVPTAATNGLKILINPKFFLSLTKGERIFLLAHETLHVVYEHMLRSGARDHYLWNVATDYRINYDLIEQGLEMPSMGLYDSKYKDMSSEEIYDALEASGERPNNLMDGDIQAIPKDQEEKVSQEIQEIVVKAVQLTQIRDAGSSIPTSILRKMALLAEPKVNWKQEVKRFLNVASRHQYSFRRPNRRYEYDYLPSKRGTKLGQLTVAADTSGSITEQDFSQIISDVAALFRAAKPESIEFLQFDHLLQGVDTLKSLGDLMRVEFKGHGGTRPEVVLDRFGQTKSQAMFVITDGYFRTENLINPNKPVIWIIINNRSFKAPFGKTIHIRQ